MAFAPLPPGEFDPYKAAHLLRRAGFGGTWDDVLELHQRGLEGAVDWLLTVPSVTTAPPPAAQLPEDEEDFQRRIRDLTEQERNRLQNERRRDENAKINELKRWWLRKMMTTRYPLQEKMTLFWHSHFASSFEGKIERTYPMWRQNEMFRRFALGKFQDQLRQVIRDPAMLVWLDNAQSRKGRPNENFARELMELFTIGVGRFTEADVKESARGLTGFGVNRREWTFYFNEKAHDGGEKTFLGNTGDWSGDDVVQILCEHPETPRFMAWKYLEFFLWPDPDPELVDAAAGIYRQNELALAPFLRTLFLSREFYSAEAQGAILKSPVQLVIGALKSMRQPLPKGRIANDALALMGQDLFFPPDVNGWPGGAAWINSNVLLLRYNFGNYLLNGVSPDHFRIFDPKETKESRREFVKRQRTEEWSPKATLKKLGADKKIHNASDATDYYLREFLQRPPPPKLRQQLVAFLETDAAGGRKSFSLNDTTFDERVRGLIHLLMSSPDYQLC